MNELIQDLKYAVRAIRRAPAFSAIAVFCLAVGIGVNAAAFGTLEAVLVGDFPGIEGRRQMNVVYLSYETKWGRLSPGQVSVPDWEILKTSLPGFSSASVDGIATVALRTNGDPRAVRADFVSGDFFATMGTRPAAGRLLLPSDDTPGAPPVVVISYELWQRDFAARDVVGTPLHVGTATLSIVGVAPKGFTGLYPGELVADPEHGAPYAFIPLAAAPLVRADSRSPSVAEALDDRWLMLAGRRRPGVSATEVEVQARAAAAHIAAAYPDDRRAASATVRSTSGAKESEGVAAAAFVMAIPLLILLVACANLANQLLARAVHRAREIAVRLSLGATRARLVRQLLVETGVLALAAGAAGLIIARLLTWALGAFFLVLPFGIAIDWRVLLFTIGLALITAVVFGLVPALRATRTDLASAMKDSGRTGGYRRSRLRSTLVVVQVAVSVALLALSGVFMHATQRSHHTETDENARHLLAISVNLDLVGYNATAGHAFQSLTMERLRNLPGVEAVSLAPFGLVGSIREQHIAIDGDKPERGRWYNIAEVRGDWFATRHAPALKGRLFTEDEARAAMPVAVVDETAAAELWPHANAVGQTVRIGDSTRATVATVIGVMPSIWNPRDVEPEGSIVVPAPARQYDSHAQFLVRTRADAASMRGSVREVMRALDPRLPVVAITTLGEALDASAVDVSLIATGVGVMGGITMLLAALGLSAVLSFIVAQRRFEIGVRIALGAQRGKVVWMVLRQSLMLSAIGIAIGALGAGAVATLLHSLLFGLPPIDPAAFAGSTAVILVVAMLASLAPARRAANVDPMVALRAD